MSFGQSDGTSCLRLLIMAVVHEDEVASTIRTRFEEREQVAQL